MANSFSRFAPSVVVDYLKTATKPEVNWYLSTGEPQCLSGDFLIEGDFVTKLFPGLRGIKVGDETASIDEAFKKAAEVRDRLAAEETMPFDLVAAGIDDEARDLQDAAEHAMMRIESIVHVGTMQEGSPAEPLEEILDSLSEGGEPALEQLPFLADVFADKNMEWEDVIQAMREHGTVGFLIQASVPLMNWREDGTASVHYGTRSLRIFYGSTFATACNAALEWARSKTQKTVERA